MKTEIEIPDVDGFEFVMIDYVTFDHKNMDCLIYSSQMDCCREIQPWDVDKLFLIYKPIKCRQIVFEEIGYDYVNPGQLYIDHTGNVSRWEMKKTSLAKYAIMKILKNEFRDDKN